MASSSLVARRYATALFDLSREQKKEEAVKSDLLVFLKLIQESEPLYRFIHSPTVSRGVAEKAIADIMDKAKANDLTKRFFALLAKSRRLDVAEESIHAFLELLAHARAEVTAEVETAAALSAESQAALALSLSKITGKHVTLSVKETPSLLGGLIVKMQDSMIDASVRGRLARLASNLKANSA